MLAVRSVPRTGLAYFVVLMSAAAFFAGIGTGFLKFAATVGVPVYVAKKSY